MYIYAYSINREGVQNEVFPLSFRWIKTGYIGYNEQKAELMCCPSFQVMGQLVDTRE